MVQNFTFDDLEDIWFRDDNGTCQKEEIEMKGKYNGYEDPAWRDYWGMNDDEEEAEPWED